MQTTMNYIGKWGLYPWFQQSEVHLVHPEDLESFSKSFPHGRVFQCVGKTDDYMILQFANEQYRVKPDFLYLLTHLHSVLELKSGSKITLNVSVWF
jgi:hypothetical protein